ncbi:GH92 family glycosyl hydrolase [Nocardioides sp.]|uniref:GH92 family glycosyl hydrolase n=1 Tax=Nocardioides sp. TaxID=35761 RepID=UPI003784ABB0
MTRPRWRSASVLAAALVLVGAGERPAAARDGVTVDVDPFVGTGGPPPWRSGGTTPAATLPFGMVQLGPDTTDDAADATPSANPSGYAATDRFVRGFSPTHLSGAGCRAFADVPVLPVPGAVPGRPEAATSELDRSTERAVPGRYSVTLGSGVAVDLAASVRTGLLRFAYPAGERAFVVVKGGGRVTFPSDHEVAVRARGGGFCGMHNHYVVHVLYRFDRRIRSHGTGPDGAWVGFGRRAVVRAQVAVSYVDAAGARRNLDLERPGWSVDRLAERARQVWEAELARVEVTGGDPDQRRLFRTALYHVLVAPTPVSDADGRYPGFDGRVHRLPAGEVQLSSVSGWDVYRTQVPLLALLRPDVAAQVVRSLHRDAVQGGWFPRWPLVAEETGVMNGDSAGPIAAASWAFGARDFPLDDVVAGLVRQGDRTDGPREGLAAYLSAGWVPVPDVRFGASTTLEYAVDDFAISRLARAAGRDGVARRYLARSGSWRHLLDADRGLLVPRAADGSFPPAGEADGCCTGFQEGNALQYTFGGVPQDMAGLLGSLGSPEAVRTRLDDFFTELDAGGEPHAWLGNEPSFVSPWAYQWLGEPGRTQDVVDRARAELWSLTPEGIPGNDDLGAMSAWYVWTSLGLYPLTPGTPNVAVGVPAFDRVVVRPSDGPALRITRVGTGAHVGGVTVDGTDRSASWLDLGPGRPRQVVVTTTPEAGSWGTAPGDRPPSYPGS